MMGYSVLFQFLISLEEFGDALGQCPCEFEELREVISYLTRIEIELLASTRSDESLSDRWAVDWQDMLGQITVSLLRHLMIQCPHCHRRVAIQVQKFQQIGKFQLDHDTVLYEKEFALSEFANHYVNGKVIRAIFNEAPKISGLPCTFHHEYGDALVEYDERLHRKPDLRYALMTDQAHKTLREIFRIKEFALMIVDLARKGAWKTTRVPEVSFEYLAVYLWDVFGISIPDVLVLTKEDYSSVLPITRVRYMTDMVANVANKLSGGCLQLEGCDECFLNLQAVAGSGIEFNHRKPGKKDENLTALRWNIWKWIAEAIRGDCDPNCTGCHGLITAFQRNIIERPDGYTGR